MFPIVAVEEERVVLCCVCCAVGGEREMLLESKTRWTFAELAVPFPSLSPCVLDICTSVSCVLCTLTVDALFGVCLAVSTRVVVAGGL